MKQGNTVTLLLLLLWAFYDSAHMFFSFSLSLILLTIFLLSATNDDGLLLILHVDQGRTDVIKNGERACLNGLSVIRRDFSPNQLFPVNY